MVKTPIHAQRQNSLLNPCFHTATHTVLHLCQVTLVSELTHHISYTVLNIVEETAEMNFQRIVMAVRLLKIVVGYLANVSQLEDAALEVIAALKVLILSESLLLCNDHLINALVERGPNIARSGRWRKDKIHLRFLRLINVEAVNLVTLVHQRFLGFEPHRKSVLVNVLALGWSN